MQKKVSVIITAAGSSTRMGGGIKKEYLPYKNGTVLSCCAKTFLNTFSNLPVQKSKYFLKSLVITCPVGGIEECLSVLQCDKEFFDLLQSQKSKGLCFKITEGSSSRQKSVFNGLKTVKSDAEDSDFVMIHDGARPFVSGKLILETLDAAEVYGAALPGLTPTDTQKSIDKDGFICEHLQRSALSAVQTPQVFKFAEIFEAHKKASEENKEYTDDSEIWGKYCGKVKIVAGDSANKKITYPQDLNFQENCAQKKNMKTNLRIGYGYDLHRLVAGRKLILGGVVLPFEKGEDGHSDGDVLFHAITDAVLGACGLGDIGSFFPPEDNRWKDADSAELLKTVMKKVRESGFEIINLDCVIKLEKPKFIPYRQAVINSVAATLGCESEQVFVKAKTGEKLPPVGTSEAVEAEVVCLVEKTA